MTSQWTANPSAYQDRPAGKPELTISIEAFPPADELATRSFKDNMRRLGGLSPEFVSVTSGAGGSGNTATSNAVAAVRSLVESPVAAHITGIDKSRQAFRDAALAHIESGVTHLVVLRGDPVQGESAPVGSYPCARDMVAAVRALPGGDAVKISVAAYPEGHPDADCAAAEIEYLKAKVEAGADQIITQFFFDTDVFLDFHARVRSAGINVPVVPGILPIENFARAASFAERCGTTIPKWYHTMYKDLEQNKPLHHAVSVSIAVEQCRQLMGFGIRAFHFYTLNRAPLTLEICERLGVGIAADNTTESDLRGAA